MLNTVPIILGIDPGARQIGISVFRGKELIFYAVKSFKKTHREESLIKLRSIIRKLILKYRVKIAAIENIVFIQQHRAFVKIVYEELKDFIKKQNLPLFDYDPNLIRVTICGLQKPTKHNAALMLSQQYPELVRYFNVPQLWQKNYFAQLFGAVAVGLVCVKELKETGESAVQSIGID